MNAAARLYRARNADVPVERVLDVGGFNLDRALDIDPEFMDPNAVHEHDDTVTSVGIEAPGDLTRRNSTRGSVVFCARRARIFSA